MRNLFDPQTGELSYDFTKGELDSFYAYVSQHEDTLIARAKLMESAGILVYYHDVECAFDHEDIHGNPLESRKPEGEKEELLHPMFQRWLEEDMVPHDFTGFVWQVSGLAAYDVEVGRDPKP